jgi:hypothetical protein
MRAFALVCVASVILIACGATVADIFHDYENFDEGFLGESFTYEGVTYHDANMVSGHYPDGGEAFGPGDPGSEFIIERATYFYNDFPDYGSPVNCLTFGRAYIEGDNLSLGALASIWMDLDQLGTAVSFDLGYYENGPWGGIEYRLEALRNGDVVGSDSFIISNLGGRDNPTFSTMAISGVVFDQLHLYGWLNDEYTVPRGIVDDLSITAVPEPGLTALLGVAGLLAIGRLRRR